MASFVVLPNIIINGRKVVATAGTQLALGTALGTPIHSGIHIKAEDTNTGYIYVGDADVSSTTGFQLAPGEAVFVEINDLAKLYIDCSVNGDGVTYIGG